MFALLAFGDSITFGTGDTKEGGWAGRLKRDFDKKDYYNAFYNLGIPGDTTTDLLKRFETEAKARIQKRRPDDSFVILLSIGTNNARFLGSLDKPQTRPADFEKSIQQLIKFSKKYTKEVFFIGLVPVDESKTNPYEETYFLNERIALFNSIIEKQCNKENIPFLDLYKEWSKEKCQNLLSDGLHPNAKGYEKMSVSIKKFLEKNGVF